MPTTLLERLLPLASSIPPSDHNPGHATDAEERENAAEPQPEPQPADEQPA